MACACRCGCEVVAAAWDIRVASSSRIAAASSARLSRSERLQFLFVQVYLGIEEQIGLRMSNAVKRR